IGATLTTVASSGTGDRTLDAAILALLVGLFCFGGSLLRLGAIANFLSKPILAGYLVGIAGSLFASQYKSLTGVPIESDGILRPTIELIGKAGQIDLATLAIGCSLFVLARLLKHFMPRFPNSVAVLVVGIICSWLFSFGQNGIAVVGNVQLG